MGIGSEVDQGEVSRWMHRDTFENVCALAEWSDDWVRDILRAIRSLGEQVRRPVTKRCIELMKAAAKLGDECEDVNMMVADCGPAVRRLINELDDEVHIHSPGFSLETGFQKLNRERLKKKKKNGSKQALD